MFYYIYIYIENILIFYYIYDCFHLNDIQIIVDFQFEIHAT